VNGAHRIGSTAHDEEASNWAGLRSRASEPCAPGALLRSPLPRTGASQSVWATAV